MYPNHYETLPATETMPAVMGNDTTSFGSVDVALTVGGEEKTVSDIVHHRAILITNEAVVWVDTDAYRIAEAEEFRERRRADAVAGNAEAEHPVAARHPTFQPTGDALLSEAARAASLEVESQFGKDSVAITLPRELAILRPVFRLRHAGELFPATDNQIAGDHIELSFSGVHNFDEGGEELELLVSSPFGEVVFGRVPGADLTWRYQGMRAESD